jgi:hypothetical protein
VANNRGILGAGAAWIDAQIQQRRGPNAGGQAFIAAAKELR